MDNVKLMIDPTEYKAFLERYIKELHEIDAPMIAGAVECCLQKLEEQPATDAVEVVHAHWEDGYSVDFKGGIVYTSIDCSHCNEIFKTDDREYWKARFKVCPFCGAIMDGERKDK